MTTASRQPTAEPPASHNSTTSDPISWLADTSLLICFGGLPNGPGLLLAAYGKTIAVTPTVRWELNRLARDEPNSARGIASGAFTGRTGTLAHAMFQRRDEPERGTALGHIKRSLGPSSPPQPRDDSPAGQEPGQQSPMEGVEHAGEAETIAVAVRTRHGVLITDKGGRRYAVGRALTVQSFTASMIRLAGKYTALELYQLWLKAQDVPNYLGPERVRGSADFRVPTKAVPSVRKSEATTEL